MVAEALACGRPAVVNTRGGAAEIVNHGEFGETFVETSGEAVAAALERIVPDRFSRLSLRHRAESFSRHKFEERFRRVIEEPMGS